MAMLYKVTKVNSPLNKEGKTRYIARPHKRKQAGFNEISQLISSVSTVSRADVIAVLYSLSEVIPDLLMDNYTVQLPGLGIFSLSFKSESYEDPSEVTHNSVKNMRVQFRPDKEIKTRLKSAKAYKNPH